MTTRREPDHWRQVLPELAERQLISSPSAAFSRLDATQVAAASTREAVRLAFAESGAEEPLPAEEEEALSSDAGFVAAVLLALGWEEADGRLRLLLTRRSPVLRANPGEIAFPGGRLDPGESALQAALREAGEEVGLDPSAVTPLGRLPLAGRSRRPREIIPVVGLVADSPPLAASAAEVAELFLVPLEELFFASSYWEERWIAGEESYEMCFFDRGEDLIWGATARMLASLLDRLANGPATLRG